MDVKRVENSLSASVLPAFAVAAGAGLTGYTIPKMTDKAGNLAPFFHAYNASNLLGSDVVQLNRAAYLDTLSFDITQKDIDKLKEQMKQDPNFRSDLADKAVLQLKESDYLEDLLKNDKNFKSNLADKVVSQLKDKDYLENLIKNDKNFRTDLANEAILQLKDEDYLKNLMNPVPNDPDHLTDKLLSQSKNKLQHKPELKLSDDEAKSLKTFVEKYLELSAKKQEKSNKELEKFVTWHAEELDIKPKDGERLKDAVKEFLKDKDAKAVRELLVPKTLENGICKNMEYGRYLEIVRETFDDVFDASTKKFKEGADKETVEFFKKSLKNFKMASAKWYALIGGGFAFIGALSANLLNSDKK